MGNKIRKIKKKAAAAVLKKTGGVPPVTLAVADPVLAFTQQIPESATEHVSINRAITRILKDVGIHRPKKGPLKKIKIQPKKVLLERLTLRKDVDGKVILEIIPGDPIATLDGKPYRPPKEKVEDGVKDGEDSSMI